MKKSTLAMLARVVAGIAILLALLPAAAQADATSTISTDLKAGGSAFVATFPYPGDKSQVAITVVWSPADTINKAQVALDVFAPDPTTGKMVKIDSAGLNKTIGRKTALINSSVAGTFVAVVHNWDSLGRTLHINLSTTNPRTGTTGPALTAVTGTAVAPAQPSAQPTPATVTDTGVLIQADPNPASYDISWVEQSTGDYFLADTSHATVVQYDLTGGPQGDHFVKFFGQGQFTGAPTTCAQPHACNGPDGVLTDNNNQIWAGNGDSTIKVIDRSSGAVTSMNTGGSLRVDEMSYDPTDQIVLAANDAEGFLTFFNATKLTVAGHFYYSDTTVAPAAGQSKSSLSTPGNGIEQSVFNPATGLFYQAMPANTIPAGEPGTSTVGRIDVFKPVPDSNGNAQLVKSFDVTGCDNGPTGLTLTANQTMVGACDNGGVVVNVADGKVLGIIPQVGGADEVWFNSGDGNVYFARSGAGMLGVGNPTTLQPIANLPTGTGSHSVAAYAANNQIVVPVNGKGIKVFQSSTPPSAQTAPVAPAATPGGAISTDLKAGGSAFAATFPYAGDKSQLQITAVWSPADVNNKAQVALDVFAPDPTTGKMVKIDTAGLNKVIGTKNALINSSVAGTFVVVVHNWDSLGRTLHINLSTTNPRTGAAGPALTAAQ